MKLTNIFTRVHEQNPRFLTVNCCCTAKKERHAISGSCLEYDGIPSKPEHLHILDYFANLKSGNILTHSVKVWIHSQMIGIPEEFCSHLLFLRGKLLMFLCIQRHRNNSGIPVGKNHVPSEFFMNADRNFCKNSSFFVSIFVKTQ